MTSPMLFSDVCTALFAAADAQVRATALWHNEEAENPVDNAFNAMPASLTKLHELVLAQHLMNFSLWHVEDIARRKDVDAAIIMDCKQRIDVFNQRRNDYMEKIDACLVELLHPFLPEHGKKSPVNTEPVGMAVDRLSILSLKIYHMQEQTLRGDAGEAHIASCTEKLRVLESQRLALQEAVSVLLSEYEAGTKRPAVYYQCKMYNDPSLNPELYNNKK